MKRIMSLLLIALMALATIFSGCAEPIDPDNGGNGGGHEHEYVKGFCTCNAVDQTYCAPELEFTKVEGGYELLPYNGHESKIIIPLEYNGEPVISISESAFEGLTSIKTVYISDNVQNIKANAFLSCSAKSIYIGKGVKTIGDFAFADCLEVKKLTYSAVNCNNLSRYGFYFRHLGQQSEECELIISACVKRIPDWLFYGTNYQNYADAKVIRFEDNSECKEIGYAAFMHMRGVKEFDWGNNPSVEIIRDSSIAVLVSLKELTIPSTVKVIEAYALGSLQQLEKLYVEDAQGWTAIKYKDSYGKELVFYRDLQSQKLLDPEEAMVYLTKAYGGGCLFTKIVDPLPEKDGWHSHEFVEGVCTYCRATEDSHIHNHNVKGVCACGNVITSHVHDFTDNGLCACKQTDITHEHEYDSSSVCGCGLYEGEETYLDS